MDHFEELNSHSKDQLCHIFNFGDSTLCLVCNITITGMTSLNSWQEFISNHLRSPGHMESMRALFQMCVPDPACNSEEGIYLDIVTKSVFDISVLLGEESSYICQKNRHLVCLMCNAVVSEICSSFDEIKLRISKHLESTEHASSIKEVCWFYRLSLEKEYLLFHKSIVHCSVCQVTIECEETKLLQTIVFHLQSSSHEIGLHFKQPKLEGQMINGLKLTESYSKCSGGMGYSEENEPDLVELESKVKKKPAKQVEGCHRHFLNSYETVTSETINDENHLRQAHIPLKTPKETIMLPTRTVENEQSQPNNSYGLVSCELVEEFMKDTCPFISNHRQFVSAKDNTMICTLCPKTIGPISNTKMNFERSLLSHITSKEHFKHLKIFMGLSESEKMESVQELFVNADINYFRVIFDGVKSHFLSEVLNIGLHPDPVSITQKKHSSNPQNKASNDMSDQPCNSQGECRHYRKLRVLGKCKACVSKTLRHLCPSLKNEPVYLVITQHNCICKICRTPFCSTDIQSFSTSYISHCDSEEHQQRLNKFLSKKQRRKEKRSKKKKKETKKDKKAKRALKKSYLLKHKNRLLQK